MNNIDKHLIRKYLNKKGFVENLNEKYGDKKSYEIEFFRYNVYFFITNIEGEYYFNESTCDTSFDCIYDVITTLEHD
jgi:hypothetical protein